MSQEQLLQLRPYHATITRGQKGGIGVEISIHTADAVCCVAESVIIYNNLCKQLGIDPKPKEVE